MDAAYLERGGAYFIRRSFEGNELYKMVFRRYLTFLIREGYTQEFFIEGGRSRTGKLHHVEFVASPLPDGLFRGEPATQVANGLGSLGIRRPSAA